MKNIIKYVMFFAKAIYLIPSILFIFFFVTVIASAFLGKVAELIDRNYYYEKCTGFYDTEHFIRATSVILATGFFCTMYRFYKKDCVKKIITDLEDEAKKKEQKRFQEYSLKEYELQLQQKTHNERINSIINGSLFKSSASLFADLHSCLYEKDEKYLKYKPHPSRTSADKLKEMRRIFKEDIENLKSQLYRYEFIIQIFPELKEYIENDEAALSLTKQSISEFKSNYDYSKDYLSTDEWNKLSDEAKWQLALNRYKERRRSNSWTAGVEYELYCAWILRKHGYTVIEHGAERKLNDLGRDLIATDGIQTYIIQCKRYSELKGIEIHENTICQLFGTTLHYTITHESFNLFQPVPVLIHTGKISDVAQEFAKKLGVVLYKMPMGDYPMIKCNINNGNKIFHLPFDQQYWNTKIDFSTGEFYATTIKEAMDAGFRRAFRWSGNTK